MNILYYIAGAALVLAAVFFFLRKIRRTTFFAVAGLAAIVCLLWGVKGMQFAAMGAQKFAPPPDTVTTALATDQSWTPVVSAVGSLAAVQGVTLSAELDGKVVGIAFESGAAVKEGDLLVQLDVSSEQAQLRSAEAAAELARVSLKRSQDLLASHTISQSEFDAADAQYKQADAQIDDVRSVIEKKTIRAPFAGRTGIRLVNLGENIKAGQAVVSLQSLDPIYVNFLIPQQEFSRIAPGLDVEVTTDALPGQKVHGRITAINPDVDSATRNVSVQATLANPSESLRPGMFAEVDVLLAGQSKVLVIPTTAVLYAPYGNSVFVLENGKDPFTGQQARILRQQFLRLGDQRGDYVSVLDGLKPGDEIVSTGAFKLRSGEAVVVKNSLSPKFQIAPKPNNS